MFNISGWEKKKGQAKEFLFASFVCYFLQLLGTGKNEDHTVRGLQREITFTWPEITAKLSRRHHWFARTMTSEKRELKFHKK